MHIYSPYIPRVLATDKSCPCYNVGMAKNTLVEVVPLAKYLGVPAAWLRAEAEQGRLPCVNAVGDFQNRIGSPSKRTQRHHGADSARKDRQS